MSQAASQSHAFKAEVAAVLRLVTNSLYQNREIFLRELISNASDALDKARFRALVQKDLRDQDAPPQITITVDRSERRLIIEDSGVGMTHDEMAKNLGTIAHSGTLRFLEEANRAQAEGKKPDLNLIGQFGVGFYSAFMAAENIDVVSLSAQPGEGAAHWASAGEGEYTLGPADRAVRGTRIELKLKEDASEFLERMRIEHVVKRYSNYVMYPIRFVELDDDGKPKAEPEQINAASAFWATNPKDLSDEDYQEFYTHIMGGFVMPGEGPLCRLHMGMDAPIQFNALLFVPARRPTEMLGDEVRGLQLFARRVLVMESCDKLLPPYLRFMRGVVDSEDLPLNVSRETLQEHRGIAAIRRSLVRKILGQLQQTADDDTEQYTKIWEQFGPFIKEGIHTDNGHREQLTELLRYPCTGPSTADGKLVSLRQYVEAMPQGQDGIYYITGDSAESLAQSPHLEACRAKGYAVLLMTDAVDEWVIQSLQQYKDKPLVGVAQAGLSLEGEAPDGPPDAAGLDTLIDRAKEVLGDRVKDVRASKRLTDSASCLVDDTDGLSRNMERILRGAGREVGSRARILELNPQNEFVQAAQALSVECPDDARVPTWIELLLDQANLAEGEVPDPVGTVRRIQQVLAQVARKGDHT